MTFGSVFRIVSRIFSPGALRTREYGIQYGIRGRGQKGEKEGRKEYGIYNTAYEDAAKRACVGRDRCDGSLQKLAVHSYAVSYSVFSE